MQKKNSISRWKQKGFTLVELMVISPIIIIALVGTIALLVNLISESVISTEKNTMTSEIQNGLDDIESSLSSASHFLNATGSSDNLRDDQQDSSYREGPASASGNNIFNSMYINGLTHDQIKFNGIITPGYRDNPGGCGSSEMSSNEIAKTNTIYFAQVSSSTSTSLKKRILTEENRSLCGDTIFPESCEALNSPSGCTNDDVLIKNGLVLFEVKYCIENNCSVSNSKSDADGASVRIVLKRSIAGKSVVNEGTRRFSLLNR